MLTTWNPGPFERERESLKLLQLVHPSVCVVVLAGDKARWKMQLGRDNKKKEEKSYGSGRIRSAPAVTVMITRYVSL